MPPGARLALAPLATALAALVAAVVLGEYEMTGATPWLSGVVIGFMVAEVELGVARLRHPALSVITAAASAASLLWAGWISSGSGVAVYPALAWPAAVVAAAVALWRTWPRSARAGSDAGPPPSAGAGRPGDGPRS